MTPPRQLAADERGIALVEVLVAAVLLIVMATATLAMVSTAESEAGRTQARSVATQLAASAQQRLRSMSAITSLIDYDRTTTSTRIANRTYTVRSQITPIRDGSDALSCTTDTSGVSYLRSQTSVTWDGPGSPLVNTSLITPSEKAVGVAYGALSVQVIDGDNTGVAGPVVTAGGRSKATNGLGCAVFENLPVGSTPVSVSKLPGYVQPNGWKLSDPSAAPTGTATIVGRGTDNETYRYGPARSASVQLYRVQQVTPALTGNLPTAVPVSLTHTDSDFGGPLVSAARSDLAAQSIANLFPFSTAYSAYAGGCAANDPTLYGGTQTAVSVAQPTTTARVPLPVVAFTIKIDNAAPPASYQARVAIKATDSGCSGIYRAVPDSSGRVAIPAPLGNYSVCLESNLGYRTTQALPTIRHAAPAGTANYNTTFSFSSNSNAQGQCS